MNHITNAGRLAWRPGRWRLASASLACAALLLPAAALAASDGPGAASARASRCAGIHTMEWVGEPPDSGAGSSFYQLEFTNLGRAACALSGYPRVVAVDGHGRQIGKPAGQEASAMRVLTLRPGGTVHVVLTVGDPYIACSHPVPTTMMRVYPPHQAGYGLVPIPAGACAGQVRMAVDAVHAGAGIPLHTVR